MAKIILIVGGSGFLGKQVTSLLLDDPEVSRIRILSRNEHSQAEMAERLKSEKIDYFIGDIRSLERVRRAIDGAHELYHFAAIKRVETAEYNPWEAVETNILGTQNIIQASTESHTIEKAIFTSTDKAVEPINVYGLSKALAEKLFIQANIGTHRVKFSVCRYGNVLGSHGSVLETWKSQLQQNAQITVVDSNMTRFFLGRREAAQFVVSSLRMMNGGEVFIPKMRSIEIQTLADWITTITNQVRVKPRPGEKIHEKLIADAELHLVTDVGDRFIRWPELNLFPVKRFGDPIREAFTSETAQRWSEEDLKCLLI